MIKYSIIIISYNQKEILKQALQSLSKQIKTPKIFEIVIADDYSNDGTDKMVKNMRAPIFLKYFKSETNIGRSEIRNLAYAKTVGEKVIFLDGDMIPQEKFIESYLQFWEEYPDAVVTGRWVDPPEYKNDPLHKYLSARGSARFDSACSLPPGYFTSGNFSINRNTFDRLNGFDPAFEGWKGEDTDFGIRLEMASTPIIYNPNAVTVHHHKRSIEDVLSDYERYGRTSFRVLISKYSHEKIFDKGWMLGFPSPNAGVTKNLLKILLAPMRSAVIIGLLKKIAIARKGRFPLQTLYSWLFYGTLAKSYKDSF